MEQFNSINTFRIDESYLIFYFIKTVSIPPWHASDRRGMKIKTLEGNESNRSKGRLSILAVVHLYQSTELCIKSKVVTFSGNSQEGFLSQFTTFAPIS